MGSGRVNLVLERARQRPGRTLAALLSLAALAGGAAWAVPQLRARASYRSAVAALAERRPAAALADLRGCLEVWPDSEEVHLLAARAARQAGDLDAAADHLAACRDPHGPRRPDVLLEVALLRAQRDGLGGVEEYLRARLGREPENAVLILEVVTAEEMKMHRLVVARSDLDTWLRVRPEDDEALVRRGWVAEQAQDFNEAIAYYRRAHAAAPQRHPVRLRLAELLVQTSQGAEALGHFEQLAEVLPGDAAVQLGRARCRALLGQNELWRQLIDQLLADQPGHVPALVERGRQALAEGEAATAEAYLRRAVAASPHDRDAVYNLQLCLARQGKADEAKHYQSAVERIDADARLMGRLLRRVQEDPGDAATRCAVGVLFLANGLDADGVRWLQTALQVDPAHADSHRALADYFERRGQPGKGTPHRRALREGAGARPRPGR